MSFANVNVVSHLINMVNPNVLELTQCQITDLLEAEIGDNNNFLLFEYDFFSFQLDSSGDYYEISIYGECPHVYDTGGNCLIEKIFEESFSRFNSVINFVLEFKKNYRYSKLLDYIIKKDEIVLKEQLFAVRKKFSGVNLEDLICCVCKEPNSTLTDICNHNLCRDCHQKIFKQKKCPVCRGNYCCLKYKFNKRY